MKRYRSFVVEGMKIVDQYDAARGAAHKALNKANAARLKMFSVTLFGRHDGL
jgi:hypothetical protein